MKNIFSIAKSAITLAVLAAFVCAASCSRGPRAVSNSTKTDGTIYTGGFATPAHGYALGDFGLVLYTDDGGKTWNRGTNSSMGLYALDSLDAKTCVAAGRDGNVTMTNDGGKTWRRLADAPVRHVKSVSFADPRLGWVASKGWVGESVDGGLAWKSIPLPPGVAMAEAVACLDSGRGMLLSADGTLFETADGGARWDVMSKPIDRKDAAFKPLFASDNHCAELRVSGARLTLVLIGSTKSGFALRELVSPDGGKTWAPPKDLALQRPPLTVSMDRSRLVSIFNADSTITQVRLSNEP